MKLNFDISKVDYCVLRASLIYSVTPFAIEAAVITPTNKVKHSCGFTDKLEIFVAFL